MQAPGLERGLRPVKAGVVRGEWPDIGPHGARRRELALGMPVKLEVILEVAE